MSPLEGEAEVIGVGDVEPWCGQHTLHHSHILLVIFSLLSGERETYVTQHLHKLHNCRGKNPNTYKHVRVAHT